LDLKSTVPKHFCDTIFEAHAKAISATGTSYNSIIYALTHTHTNDSEKGDTKNSSLRSCPQQKNGTVC
jgi:hypothetical protein